MSDLPNLSYLYGSRNSSLDPYLITSAERRRRTANALLETFICDFLKKEIKLSQKPDFWSRGIFQTS